MSYPNLIPVLPELFMAFMIICILLVDAFMPQTKKSIIDSSPAPAITKSGREINTFLTLFTLAGCFILQKIVDRGTIQVTFNDMFILDGIAAGTKMATYLFSFITVLYINRYVTDKKMLKGEFYAIFLFAVLGMMVMISADNMLVLYVGLELQSLALYGLIALYRDNVKATESAMKYFILGALASGILLYGISFIYGATGGYLQLEYVVRAMLIQNNANQGLLIFGLAFIVAGLVFKLGLVPFHMWIPDVYEGSALAVTTIIGSLTKIAAVVFIIRFLIGGLVLLNQSWSFMLLILACLSLFFGNIIAIAQTNVKRIMGYSAVSQMGFVALGLVTVSVDGAVATLFYIITYSLTALAGFGILTMLSKDEFECETLDDLRGLGKTNPVYAGLLSLVMFSMAGIPPLVGFYAKFKILAVLISSGYIAVAVFAVIMSLIGAFYYIRIVKAMYFDQPVIDIIPATTCIFSRAVLLANGALLILIGVMPSALLMYCKQLISS